jgi:hypothetical protein
MHGMFHLSPSFPQLSALNYVLVSKSLSRQPFRRQAVFSKTVLSKLLKWEKYAALDLCMINYNVGIFKGGGHVPRILQVSATLPGNGLGGGAIEAGSKPILNFM